MTWSLLFLFICKCVQDQYVQALTGSMWLHKWVLIYAEQTSLSLLIRLYWSCGKFFVMLYLWKTKVLTLLNIPIEWGACLLWKIWLLNPSPENSAWMGLIKPSWSKTPNKDVYLESLCSLDWGLPWRKFILWTFLEARLA